MSKASPGSGQASRGPTPSSEIIATRDALLASGVGGLAFSRAWSDALDSWLAERFQTATGTDAAGVSLVAVGANGRREPSPCGDLDLVLLHAPKRDVAALADALWYPIWDSGIKLDHSVRTPRQAVAESTEDWKVAVGLLDARVVAGDAQLLAELAPVVSTAWKAQARRVLPQIVGDAEMRHERHGDVAHLLEPDLKEGRGGLRDVHWLRAAAEGVPGVVARARPAALPRRSARSSVSRVALHAVTRSASNLLTLQDQDAVADRLGKLDADALMADVSAAGRTIAIAADDVARGCWPGHRSESAG